MARTDKDAPSWVRAHHNLHAAEISHYWLCEHSRFAGRIDPHHRTVCDLNGADPRTNRCRYYLPDRTRWPSGTSPSAERLHIDYYGPERATVRDNLRNAAREYNHYGTDDTTEPDPPTRQTRRSNWYGGWWD